MRYGELTWLDMQDLEKDRVVAVCPIASLEQHGHHLPLLTDTFLVTGVAERVHEKLADRILLTPTLWLGASDHHLDFPGTISVPNTVYVEMIKSVAASMVQAGFSRILLLNGHGGNIAPGETAITELANEIDECDEVYVTLASYWTVAQAAMKPEAHGMQTPSLTHACEYETSMMLHLHERLVKMERARGQADPVVPAPPTVRVAGRFHRMSPTGALGRPELATAEKGESLFGAIAGEVAALIENMLTWPERKVLGP